MASERSGSDTWHVEDVEERKSVGFPSRSDRLRRVAGSRFPERPPEALTWVGVQRSAATIDGYRRTIRAALSAAQRRELIAVNPAVGRMDSIPTSAGIDVSVTGNQVTSEQAAFPVCGEVHIGRLFKAPKSRKGRRWVPLAAPAQEALARHREAQRQEREFFGVDYRDHGPVFCRPDGLPLRPDRVTVEFGGMWPRAGCRWCGCTTPGTARAR